MRSLPSLSLASALLAAGCASAPPPATAPHLPPHLPVIEVPDLELRALLLLLVDRQTYEPVTVDQALRGTAELREALAVALGRIGDRQARSATVGLLLDAEVTVRRAAAFALGELEDPAAAPALLAAVAAPDRETGVLAVEALGKLGSPLAPLAEVEKRLASLPEEERQARLLPHLFRFADPAKVPAAERGLASPDPALHARAAYALARQPRPEAAPALRRLLADPDPWVRGWAARGLGEVGDGSDLARLRPLLDDADPGPIVQALRAGARLVEAGKAAAPAAWRPRLLALVDDPRAGLRVTALEAASGWLLDDQLGAALAARVETGTGRERGTALLALAKAGDPRAADLATRASTAEDPDVRARAAEAAGELRAEGLLRRLAADPSAEVRGAAFGAWLGALTAAAPAAPPAASPDPKAVPAVAVEVALAALADPDAGVRATGLSWATAHPAVPLERLERALAASLADRTVESGMEAVRALAARAEAEPLERGAIVALLEKVAAGGDWVLRREAANLLVGLGRPALEPGPVATGKDVAAYREIVQRTWRPRTVEIATGRGAIRVRLACPEAPMTCLNLLSLASQGFYDGIVFHRVVPDFVVQAGDPRGDGFGGPGYTIRDEIGRLRYGRGVMGMALAGPDTGGSQFFLTLSPQPHLDGGFTAFGEVVAGDDVLDLIEADDRIVSVREVP